MPSMYLALFIFVMTYAAMIALPKYRAHTALISAGLMILFGFVPLAEAFHEINWNVMMTIAGTMGLVAIFIESMMPARLADRIIDRMPDVKWVTIAISLFAGFISAFVDNVSTVLMVAPIAIVVSKKLDFSPVKMVIAISIASNLQGAATLVGDTTSIMLAGFADLNFMDFFFFQGKPGLFWIIQIAMLASTAFLYFYMKRDNKKVEARNLTKVEDYFPSWMLLGMVLTLVVCSFIDLPEIFFLPHTAKNATGYVCMIFLLLTILVEAKKNSFQKTMHTVLADLDVFTLLLLAGLFIVIAGIRNAGVIDQVARLFTQAGGKSPFLMYTLLVWASVLFSAFIDNIPYVATMLPVVAGIAANMGIDPTVLYFGLLSGATLGGNLTPIGASANITGIGMLRKEGYEVSNKRFMSMSVPYTLIAVLVGYLLIWRFFGIG